MKERMRLTAIPILLVLASSAAQAEAPPNVRLITAEERKSCQYLGLVSIGSAWAWHSSKGAMKGAMKQVQKMGGDSLFLAGQGQDWFSGASVNGEAYRCAPKG